MSKSKVTAAFKPRPQKQESRLLKTLAQKLERIPRYQKSAKPGEGALITAPGKRP